ncbi:uncharacterized protein LOC125943561 [Dermacentor silvarum]|uniref:uncharacterized protein LOC125943561 n=1 Tax=Dermacentor silvarum TaxID=543639 RepID=UPI002100E709|nr:uncharacterized protein LOC125943561 [Dermacentor silvarum]
MHALVIGAIAVLALAVAFCCGQQRPPVTTGTVHGGTPHAALLLEPGWLAEMQADCLRTGLERVVGRRATSGRRCWQRCHSGGGRAAEVATRTRKPWAPKKVRSEVEAPDRGRRSSSTFKTILRKSKGFPLVAKASQAMLERKQETRLMLGSTRANRRFELLMAMRRLA